jgi:hypothetical protein
MRFRFLAIVALVLLFPSILRAGGPAWVAGAGYDPGVEGQPILWANATVQYFTDQGDLSPILTNAQADAFVLTAISPWTTAAGVGLTVTQAGHLAEDVNGGNIQGEFGVITAPPDITSQATSTPLGIVYDYDGTVTDALLGEGAGSLADCFTNAVYGGPDNFSASGNIVHAVAIINGVCAATTSQLPDVQYRLVRVLGHIFGLAWSQANDNVLTHNPYPGAADFAGFPVMHFEDPINCVPISLCYPNAAVPKMDDITALARLYPGANPQPTGRIWGNVYFTDASGAARQQMQGVNVVARLMDNGVPSRQYVVTSVSGFAFVGNAGNIITGYDDPGGLPFNRFGSGDTSVEGFYDLGQLTIPSGRTTAQYQLAVEAIDPNWSWGVEPYGPSQVAPSGSFAPVVVTIQNGSNVERDILVLQSAIAHSHPGSGSTYTSPAPLPQGGGWASWISGYGSSDFFAFNVQANRTASVAVIALDETGAPTESKAQPVIGIWELSDNTGNPAPAATPSAFNTLHFGETRLDADFIASETYKIGIADDRGDGRPDYAYQASVLYSDTITPARLGLAGGVATLEGIGFRSGLKVDNGVSGGTVFSQSATQLQISLPGTQTDGVATVEVTDPVTGSFSQMENALTYGAAATDLLQLLQGASQSSPIGAQAPSIIRIRAVADDTITPVNGATIVWSATNNVQLSACNGASSCSVLTDGAGEASTSATATAIGQSTITAQLAPASYQPPQTQQATLVGTASAQDLAALSPTRWLAQGITLGLTLTVEALNMGVPQAGVNIRFTVTNGSASLSPTTATTNSAGMATTTATVTNLNATVQVSACVTPAGSPCQTFTIFAVPPTSWKLEAVSGSSQIVPNGQPFQPLVMRVTDGSASDNPVQGTTVTFQTTLERNPQGSGGGPPQGNAMKAQNAEGAPLKLSFGLSGELNAMTDTGAPQIAAQDAAPVILGTSQTQVVSDQNGLAAITPTVGDQGPCDAFIVVTAGSATTQFELINVDALPSTWQPPQPPSNPKSSPRRFIPFFIPSAPTPDELSIQLFAIPQEMPAAAETPPSERTITEPPADDPSSTTCPVADQKPKALDPAAQDIGVSCPQRDQSPDKKPDNSASDHPSAKANPKSGQPPNE